ncbi:hypothetical protein Esti_004484 [Eimeria stiedai]
MDRTEEGPPFKDGGSHAAAAAEPLSNVSALAYSSNNNSSSSDTSSSNNNNSSSNVSSSTNVSSSPNVSSSNSSSSNSSSSSSSSSSVGVDESALSDLVSRYLPSNYDFEVLKAARRLAAESVKRAALQLPEGLLAWGYQISAILLRTVSCLQEVFLLGDVSYGACCVDDLKAEALGAELLLHYGHSCLVPTQHTQGDRAAAAAAAGERAAGGVAPRPDPSSDAAAAAPPSTGEFSNSNSSSNRSSSRRQGGEVVGLRVHYVFVDVLVDPADLASQLTQHLPPTEKLALQGTIQFAKTIHAAKKLLDASGHFTQPPFIPQVLPLTAGEVLGCTAPRLRPVAAAAAAAAAAGTAAGEDRFAAGSPCGSSSCCSVASEGIEALAARGCSGAPSYYKGAPGEGPPEVSTVVFVADGRFHMEASMIQNPEVDFLRYDPFSKRLFRENFAHERMHALRRSAIEEARGAKMVGLLLSTLGRQASLGLAEDLLRLLESKGLLVIPILMSEFAPHKLEALCPFVEAFVQVGCPRLSIDWGSAFSKPLLSPYEAHVAFGSQPYLEPYPMDFYSRSGGPWTNYNTSAGDRRGSLAVKVSPDSRRAELRGRLLARQQQRQQQRRQQGQS